MKKNAEIANHKAVAAKKTVTKRVREFEVVASDRMQLIEAANTFVEHIVTKQVMPTLGSGVVTINTELSDNEVETFNSALGFLKRQFDMGYSSTEPHEKRIEHEDTKEFQ